MAICDPSEMEPDEALRAMGLLVDVSFSLKRKEGLRYTIEHLTKLAARDLGAGQRMLNHYFLGNAWHCIRTLVRRGTDADWDWQYEELENEIAHFRLALRAAEETEVPVTRLCQAHTNLGSALNSAGRFVEAIEHWNAALSLDAGFSMATANKGHGLFAYAAVLYDEGHAALLLRGAHQLLTEGLKGSLVPEAVPLYAELRSRIEAMVPEQFLREGPDLEAWQVEASPEEKAYRGWCLTERLFLNPLNDVGPHAVAARDVLLTPSIVVPFGEGPYYQGFYNQMKQEYVSARYLLYVGARMGGPHYSDGEVLLFNTLDYPSYALSVEQQKLALRSAYSILDKAAFFLNHYMELGLRPNQVSLRRLWYVRGDRRRGLRSEFQRRPNWPLRGLFWLSKDLFDDETGSREATDPDARCLADIRNRLEHKYLKVHENDWPGPPDSEDGLARALSDTLAHSIRRNELTRLALKMMRVARAALIYLSLGVHMEEKAREAKRGSEKIAAPIFLELWEDDWKR